MIPVSRMNSAHSFFSMGSQEPFSMGQRPAAAAPRNLFERPLQMTVISGNGAPKPSFFSASVADSAGFHPQLASPVRRFSIGQSLMEWYDKAKKAIALFDDLLNRTAKIANKTEREAVLAWIGTAADTSSPAYRYATVKSDLSDVEKTTPLSEGVKQYETSRRTNRIEKLEDFNSTFKAKVTNALNVFGALPAPVIINKERIVQMSGGIPTTTLLIGGAAVAGLAVLIILLKPK